MDSRNMSFGGESIDWADPAFSTSEFQDSMVAESPWGNSALNDFTNLADYSDSPAAFGLRTPSKSGPDASAMAGAQQSPSQGRPNATHMSNELSSQDSSSDASSRRKRKSISESPMPDASAVDSKMQNMVSPNPNDYQSFHRPLPSLNVDQGMTDQGEAMFDFNSAASSPNLPRDFNQQLSLDANMAIRKSPVVPPFVQDSPATMNPGSMFTIGGSRDQSPATNNVMFNTASPNAIFSTPSSDSNDFAVNQNWNATVGQNPAWPTDFGSQFASPGLAFTPSPVANGGTPSMASRTIVRAGRSPLHIAPISTKSRVETQINVVMTLEKPPPGAEHLHLPLHTIAKSKLLAKEDYDKSKVLELHTMLVCTSAMHNANMKEKALKRAAQQDNAEIQRKAEQHREGSEDDKSESKSPDDEEKPANGGEVKICSNCIQRERKRAGRKKLKKEEEQLHWERYETERVVVFNSNEYLPFKPAEQMPQPQRDGGMGADEPYNPPEGAISVQAQMRIACYCRHQSEKEGFQVIFTIKDQQRNVVAQEISDSILITDDHKTHPPQLTTSELLYHPQLNQNGLPTSYSMVDLQSHSQPFTSSRSAGNLQALAYGQQPQFNPHSHVHQLPNNGFPSQATSATMTPTNLSRPGSPSSAGQAGPNKKRKSSSFHKRLPSGLQMTPRVDTNQPSSANALSGVTMSSQFSPTGAAFPQNDPSFMTIPNSGGAAQFFGSQPSTPANEHPGFAFNAAHQLDISRAQNASAYFSHPSSAVPSRSNSPILQHNRNLSGYTRQPLQTTTNQIGRAAQFYGGQSAPGTAQTDEGDQPGPPTITKITPTQGPTAGGTEVSIFGYNFTHSTQIMFGDNIAPTTFYGEQSILAISPPGRRGQVRLRVVPGQNMARALQYTTSQGSNAVFTYLDTDTQMMEMALRYLSQQQTGDPGRWMQYTNDVANQFMQTSISPAGIQGQAYPGGNVMAEYDGGSAYDADESECAITRESSRRNSAFDPATAVVQTLPAVSEAPTAAAMIAWRDALAAQIGQFQQTVQGHVPSFQMPALPPLPDYQDYAMVRRLSALVPAGYFSRTNVALEAVERRAPPSRLWDFFSPTAPPPTSFPPPPAYSELFPEEAAEAIRKGGNKTACQTAAVDTVADQKCAILFDGVTESTSSSSGPTGVLSSLAPSKTEGATAAMLPSWLWISALLVLVFSILMFAVLPCVGLDQTFEGISTAAYGRLLVGW